jgi:diaminohydroxyphosphoribosylaminopyrimidine deaminase / 5-amino-6-(5-phosphoribosylamino)uracil reductase
MGHWSCSQYPSIYANLCHQFKDAGTCVTNICTDPPPASGREGGLEGSAALPGRAAGPDSDWLAVLAAIRTPGAPVPPAWAALFSPLAGGSVDDIVVIAQVGQTLDGRIATHSGHSHYINGDEGLDHLHRLRAVVDAVIVGVGTARADDPQLTVRRVCGPHPARVVIDPNGRLPAGARMLAGDGVRRIVVRSPGVKSALPDGVEIVELASEAGCIAPAAIVADLARRGLRRILVEGGAGTVSRFLAAGCLDRMHIVVAPIILGSGAPCLALPPVDRMEQALRPRTHTHVLRNEVLFDCDLSDQRVVIGCAKKST